MAKGSTRSHSGAGAPRARAATNRRRQRPERDTAAGWVATLLLIVAIIVAGWLAHGGGLDAPFIFDDAGAIVANPYVARLWPLTEAMRAPVQSAFAGRPIASLSLALSYATGDGLSPAGFRLWNVAFLVASALALFGIVRRTLQRQPFKDDHRSATFVALAVALLWVVHPLQTEVVGYVTQRTESLMGLFYLLTLYAATRALPRGDEALSRNWTIAAIAACTLGMLTKESMVTAPLMVLLYDVVFVAPSGPGLLPRRRLLYGGLAATWIVLALVNLSAPRFRSAGFTTGVSPWTYLVNQGPMMATYLKLSVWPHPLVLDYGPTQPIALASALPGLGLVLLLLGATVFAWMTSRRALAFLGTWFFVTLAPSSSFVPIATEVGAERRMFLPLAAVIVLAVLAVRAAVRHWARDSALRQPAVAATALTVVAILFGSVSALRAREYRDPVTLWQRVLAARPHGRAHYNLAFHLKQNGRTAEAIQEYRAALPGTVEAHYALGFEYGEAGQSGNAAAELQEFLRLKPHDALAPKAAYLLGQSLARLGRTAEAEPAYRDALRMSPENVEALVALADLFLSAQRFSEAAATYRDYLQRVPTNAGAHHNLGMALVGLEQDADAVKAFEQAVTLKPNEAMLQLSLGQALASAGRLDDAVDHLREALKLAPDNPRVMSALALTLAAGGEVNDPLDLFRRARQLAPDDPSVQADYDLAVARWRGQHQ